MEIMQRKTFNDDTFEFAYTNPYVLRSDINAIQLTLGNLEANIKDIKQNIDKKFDAITEVKSNIQEINTKFESLSKRLEQRFYVVDKHFDDYNQIQNNRFMLFGILIGLVPLITVFIERLMR